MTAGKFVVNVRKEWGRTGRTILVLCTFMGVCTMPSVNSSIRVTSTAGRGLRFSPDVSNI